MDYRKWAEKTKAMYRMMRMAGNHQVEVMGKTFEVLEEVFSPRFARNSAYFAEYLIGICKGKTLLDMGAGCGSTTVLCAMAGAIVTSTDINPEAVLNVVINARKHGIEWDCAWGDLFEPIEVGEKYDLIFWNHPFNYTDKPVKDRLMMAGFDYQYSSLRRFIREAKDYLADDGAVILGSGEFARADIIYEEAREAGFAIEIVKRDHLPLKVGGKETTEFIIYRMSRVSE